MNWLDVALTTPTIGILCEPRLQFPHDMLVALRPALEKWKTAHPNLTFYVPAEDCLVQIKIGDGVVCELLGNAFNVKFGYESRVINPPAGLPVIEHPNVYPFSELVSRTSDALSTICEYITSPAISVLRIGVVAECHLDARALPPGVRKFLDHLGRPWGKEPAIVNGTITSELASHDGWNTRCHHNLDFNPGERPNGDVRLRLDWQRFRADGYALSKTSARRFIDDTVKSANGYFGTFGAGALSYGS